MDKRTRRYEACQGSYAGMHPAQGFTFQLKLWQIVLSFHHGPEHITYANDRYRQLLFEI